MACTSDYWDNRHAQGFKINFKKIKQSMNAQNIAHTLMVQLALVD